MTIDISRTIAAMTVWCEARGEGEAGMTAVAWAIVNRHRAGKWFSGLTLAECCLKSFAFSCWNTGDPNRVQAARLKGDEGILQDIDGYLADALNGNGDDPTQGATHYVSSGASPSWAEGKTPCATIGKLIFYKDID